MCVVHVWVYVWGLACVLASVCLYSSYGAWKAAGTPEKGVCDEEMRGQGITKGGENGERSCEPLGLETGGKDADGKKKGS